MSTQDEDDVVLYRREQHLAIVTFNRPDRLNAWTPTLGERYFELLNRAADDPEVRVIVVTGAGRGFCAGADMDSLDDNSRLSGQGGRPAEAHPERTLSIPKPVIAVINGPCVGLGLVFALMCDLRFAATEAKIGATFSRLGLVAEDGSSWLLPRIIGTARAMDLLLSGRMIAGAEAERIGLVNQAFAAEELMPRVIDYATDMAAHCAPSALAQIKAQIYRDAEIDLDTSLAESSVLTSAALAGEDFREGIASYAERRPPRFAELTSRPPGYDRLQTRGRS